MHVVSVPKSQRAALSPGEIYQIVATKKPSQLLYTQEPTLRLAELLKRDWLWVFIPLTREISWEK